MTATTDTSLSKATCIYCDQSNPFTDEHVFSAGMGGDDSDFLLKDLVCGECNTNVFSPLEAQLMRNSPIALARLYEQPTGRGKGNKAKPPEFQSERCEITDPDTGRISEAEMTGGGVPVSLPQLQIQLADAHSPDNLPASMSAPDEASLRSFLEDLSPLLGQTATLIAKGGKARFEVTTYGWAENSYVEKEKMVLPKPPAGIWHEPLAGTDGKAVGWPRLYRRLRGQFVLRVMTSDDIAEFLSNARKVLPHLNRDSLPPATSIEKPDVHIGMAVLPMEILRATVKIGVNIACHEYGDALVRSKDFARIKKFIMTGDLASTPVPDTERLKFLETIFGLERRSVHIAILYPCKIASGRTMLLFLLKLYGGVMQAFPLAEVTQQLALSPTVFVVNYLQHKIERLALEDYMHHLLNGKPGTND